METYTYKLVEDEHGNIQCGDKLYRFEETIKYGGYMKIIDLLNKIANGEEVPIKFTYKGYLWEYDVKNKMWFYYFGKDKNHRFDRLFYINQILNDEIKIIEEEHKIPEKLDIVLLDQSDNWTRKYNKNLKDFESAHIELNPYVIDVIRQNTLEFQSKINEIIDYIEPKYTGSTYTIKRDED